MILLLLPWRHCFLGLLWLCSLTRKNAVGWGPFSHAAFGSLYYDSLCRLETTAPVTQTRLLRGQPQKTLISNNNITLYPSAPPPSLQEAVFVTANAFPDAFKNTRSWMHSLEYAAFQVEKAALWNSTIETESSLHSGEHYLNHSTKKPSSSYSVHYHWNNSLDFIQADVVKAFSYGYLFHLLHDYVGHHPNGYLNPEKDHPLEFDVDTLVFELHKTDGAPWFFVNHEMAVIAKNKQIRHDVASFVSETTQQFAQLLKTARNSYKGGTADKHYWLGKIDNALLVDSSSGLSIKQVVHCLDRFALLINMEAVAMTANSRTYKNGMVRYNVCGARNFGDANDTLKTAILWTGNALHVLEKHLFPWDLSSPVRHHSHQNDSAVSNKALDASIVARSWIDDTFQMNGGTICNHNWEFA